MSIENLILLGAWIISFGLVGLVMFFYVQADAAHQKLADEWALSRCDIERRLKQVPDHLLRS